MIHPPSILPLALVALERLSTCAKPRSGGTHKALADRAGCCVICCAGVPVGDDVWHVPERPVRGQRWAGQRGVHLQPEEQARRQGRPHPALQDARRAQGVSAPLRSHGPLRIRRCWAGVPLKRSLLLWLPCHSMAQEPCPPQSVIAYSIPSGTLVPLSSILTTCGNPLPFSTESPTSSKSSVQNIHMPSKPVEGSYCCNYAD